MAKARTASMNILFVPSTKKLLFRKTNSFTEQGSPISCHRHFRQDNKLYCKKNHIGRLSADYADSCHKMSLIGGTTTNSTPPEEEYSDLQSRIVDYYRNSFDYHQPVTKKLRVTPKAAKRKLEVVSTSMIKGEQIMLNKRVPATTKPKRNISWIAKTGSNGKLPNVGLNWRFRMRKFIANNNSKTPSSTSPYTPLNYNSPLLNSKKTQRNPLLLRIHARLAGMLLHKS